MASTTKEIAMDWSPVLLVYTDGSVERFKDSPLMPPALSDPAAGVSSKDFSISAHVSARLFLPDHPTPADNHRRMLPIVVYFHGGGFSFESPFSALYHRYISTLASQVRVVAVSVKYRLAPENPLPAAYEDSWAALQWVCSHSAGGQHPDWKEPWLISHGDFDRLFVGGSASGGNIAHNLAMRAGWEPLLGNVKILGAFLLQPLFWGTKPIRAEPKTRDPNNIFYKLWMQVFTSLPGGPDNPMVNPFSAEAAILAGLGCSRLLVVVAEKDISRDRGLHYCDAVAKSGWPGKLEVHQIEGRWHLFGVKDPDTDMAKKMMNALEQLQQWLTPKNLTPFWR